MSFLENRSNGEDAGDPDNATMLENEVVEQEEVFVDGMHPRGRRNRSCCFQLKVSENQWERRAWYLYDASNSVYVNTALQAFLPVLMSNLFGPAFFSLCVSISVLIQCVVFMSSSAAADFGNMRKRLMAVFSLLGAFCTALFWFVQNSDQKVFAAFLLVMSNVSYGASYVFYNAYLPVLCEAHESMAGTSRASQTWRKARLALEEVVSNIGFMAGYAGGLFMTVLNIIVTAAIVLTNKDMDPTIRSSYAARVNIMFAGLWWFTGSIVSLKGLKDRPGPPLPAGQNVITAAWKRVAHTFKNIRQLPTLSKFLAMFFAYADGANALGSLAVVFAVNELSLPVEFLGILLLESQLFAFAGCVLYSKLQKYIQQRYAIREEQSGLFIIAINLCFLGLLPLYAMLGMLPGMTFGMKSLWELFSFAGIYGLQIGSIQTFSRSIFSSIVPANHEAEFFGFFEITDKGSSWIAPLIASIVLQHTKRSCGWHSDALGYSVHQPGPELCMQLSDMSKPCPGKTLAGPRSLPDGFADGNDDGWRAICQTNGSARWAMLPVCLLCIIPVPFLIKSLRLEKAWVEAEAYTSAHKGADAALYDDETGHEDPETEADEHVRPLSAVQPSEGLYGQGDSAGEGMGVPMISRNSARIA